MEGLNPNEVVKAIHIRFIPNQTKLDNLAGPAFKDQCSLELRNIIDTEKVVVDGKLKSMTTLLPIATAVARLKSGNGNGGGSQSSNSNGGSSAGSESGNSGGQSQQTSYNLTIARSGSGTSTVKDDSENVITGQRSFAPGTNLNIEIIPAEGQVPTATINGNNIALTENDGTYNGSFQMPAQGSVLELNSGSNGDNDDDGLDKD
jgi:uncharacterized spore protein YtfJ